MADINLSQQDIDYIARVVDTEVPRGLAKSNPQEYERMVKAVTDTVVNRVASGSYPGNVTDVLNQRRQFSKITGPSRLDPYGSVQKTPKAPAEVRSLVSTHVANRVQGAPSIVGGSLSYANPNVSDKSNLLSWVNPMIERGAQMFGVGQSVHFHGNAPGQQPSRAFTLSAESIPDGDIPTPRDRFAPPQSQAAYGIMGAIDPVRVGPVERGLLGPVSPRREEVATFDTERFGPAPSTETFDRARFGVEPNVAPRELPQALQDQRATMGLGFDDARFGTGQNIAATGLAQALREQQTAMGPTTPTIDRTITGGVGTSMPSRPGQQTSGLLSPPASPMPSVPTDIDFAQEVDDYRTSIGKAPVNAGLLGPATTYTDPMVTAAPARQQPVAPEVANGLISPAEYRQVQAQRSLLGPVAPSVPQEAGLLGAGRGRNMTGGLTGGILGGLALGPLGAIAGGLLGREIARRTYFPAAPTPAMAKTPAQIAAPVTRQNDHGYSSLNDLGRETYSKSEQFRDAVDSKRGGLW